MTPEIIVSDIHLTASKNAGKLRERNEDCFFIGSNDRRYIAVVADGLGGAPAGDIASLLVCRTAEEYFYASDTELSAEKLVADIGYAANRAMGSAVVEGVIGARAGMASTAVIAVVDADQKTFTVDHSGDSRAYLYSPDNEGLGTLHQLTVDHTIAQDSLDSGLSPHDVLVWEHHVLTQCVDGDMRTEKFNSAQTHSYSPGDMLLLCSDGLYNELSDAEIVEAMTHADNPAKALVERVMSTPARDNVTVVVAQL